MAETSRISDIARQIRGAVNPVLGADQSRTDAKDALTAASEGATTVRTGIMIQLAALAMHGEWTEGEISVAAKQAAAMSNNDTEKALGTFIGETKKAMHPKVRAHTASLASLAEDVWSAEKEDKDSTQPCRKAFKRQYHMFQRMLGACVDDGVLYQSASDVVQWAKLNDPDYDPDKVLKRIQRMCSELQEISAAFPLSDFGDVSEVLVGITAATLKAARVEVAKAENARMQSHKLAPVLVSSTVVENVTEPAAGAGFDLDDVLNELAA